MLAIQIRDERESDRMAISAITVSAFENLEYSSQTEQFIIHALRKANALSISLVAEVAGEIVAHIAFSPVTMSDGSENWYGLGPLSVKPDYQRQGIGKALVQAGLSKLHTLNAQGCCVVGHPDYYPKFGFQNVSGLELEGVPAEYFFALTFVGRFPQGTVTFHPGFQATC